MQKILKSLCSFFFHDIIFHELVEDPSLINKLLIFEKKVTVKEVKALLTSYTVKKNQGLQTFKEQWQSSDDGRL